MTRLGWAPATAFRKRAASPVTTIDRLVPDVLTEESEEDARRRRLAEVLLRNGPTTEGKGVGSTLPSSN